MTEIYHINNKSELLIHTEMLKGIVNHEQRSYKTYLETIMHIVQHKH